VLEGSEYKETTDQQNSPVSHEVVGHGDHAIQAPESDAAAVKQVDQSNSESKRPLTSGPSIPELKSENVEEAQVSEFSEGAKVSHEPGDTKNLGQSKEVEDSAPSEESRKPDEGGSTSNLSHGMTNTSTAEDGAKQASDNDNSRTIEQETPKELELAAHVTVIEQPDNQPEPPSAPLEEEISTRNLIILDRFEDLPSQIRHDYSMFYNQRKAGKGTKHVPELCPLTGQPAKYRDPATGIGYGSVAAYKKVQELQQHKYSWSSMLGCYVGRAGVAARGAPEGFLGS
jgi:vacuolar protein sorting-associated protein 72